MAGNKVLTQRRLLPHALFALVTLELVALATGLQGVDVLARGAFVVLCAIGLFAATVREWALFALAVGVAVLAWGITGRADALWPALNIAAFFAAFIVLLTFMKDVAARSASVLAVGRYLTAQSAGRRFYATAVGGHILGVFLNFGAISLMAPLVQRSAVDAKGAPSPALERRQLSALLRGFSWILLWAPTTLSQAVLLTIFTEVRWSDLVLPGLGASVLMIALGRVYDRFEWRGAALPDSPGAGPLPLRAAAISGMICTVLITGTFVFSGITGFSIAAALMFVAPTVTLVWFILQDPAARHGPAVLQRVLAFGPIIQSSAPALARSAMALGLSGFIGRVAATVLPVADLAAWLDLAGMPGWLFLAILPILINLGGQVALSPILLVVFIGEVLATVPDLPAEPAHILFALSAGWSLSMMASPNATATLLIASTCNIAPTTLTWRWNLRYGLLCYVAFVCIFIALTIT